jgi:hypothetical protein
VVTAQNRHAEAGGDLSFKVDSRFTYDFEFDGDALAADHRAQPILVCPHLSQAPEFCPSP